MKYWPCPKGSGDQLSGELYRSLLFGTFHSDALTGMQRVNPPLYQEYLCVECGAFYMHQ